MKSNVSPAMKSAMASAGRVMTFTTGSRTSKLIVLYLWLSTAVLALTVYKAPAQLAAAGVAIGALGGGAASLKLGNGYEAKHSKNGAGDPTS